MKREGYVGKINPLTSARKQRNGEGTWTGISRSYTHPSDLLPPLKPHFLVISLTYDCTRGLVNCLSQSLQDHLQTLLGL